MACTDCVQVPAEAQLKGAHFSGEHNQGGLDGVGHGNCVVGKHLRQAGGCHESWGGAGGRRHNPVDRIRLLAAISSGALQWCDLSSCQGFVPHCSIIAQCSFVKLFKAES